MHCCAPFVGRLSMLGRFQSLRKRIYLSVLSYQSYVISLGSHFYVAPMWIFSYLSSIHHRHSLSFVSDNYLHILKYIVLPETRLYLEVAPSLGPCALKNPVFTWLEWILTRQDATGNWGDRGDGGWGRTEVSGLRTKRKNISKSSWLNSVMAGWASLLPGRTLSTHRFDQ